MICDVYDVYDGGFFLTGGRVCDPLLHFRQQVQLRRAGTGGKRGVQERAAGEGRGKGGYKTPLRAPTLLSILIPR